MLKSLTDLAILTFLGASVVALPSISQVGAGETAVFTAKGDRLDHSERLLAASLAEFLTSLFAR